MDKSSLAILGKGRIAMSNGQKGVIVGPDEGRALSVGGDTYTEKVLGQNTNGAYTAMVLTVRSSNRHLDMYTLTSRRRFTSSRVSGNSRWMERPRGPRQEHSFCSFEERLTRFIV